MATLNPVVQPSTVLHQILQEYCAILNRKNDWPTSKVIVSDDRARYLVITEGWNGQTRVHSLIFDAELRNGKIWIHHDVLVPNNKVLHHQIRYEVQWIYNTKYEIENTIPQDTVSSSK